MACRLCFKICFNCLFVSQIIFFTDFKQIIKQINFKIPEINDTLSSLLWATICLRKKSSKEK